MGSQEWKETREDLYPTSIKGGERRGTWGKVRCSLTLSLVTRWKREEPVKTQAHQQSLR